MWQCNRTKDTFTNTSLVSLPVFLSLSLWHPLYFIIHTNVISASNGHQHISHITTALYFLIIKQRQNSNILSATLHTITIPAKSSQQHSLHTHQIIILTYPHNNSTPNQHNISYYYNIAPKFTSRAQYHYITCSPVDPLYWMGAVRMRVL